MVYNYIGSDLVITVGNSVNLWRARCVCGSVCGKLGLTGVININAGGRYWSINATEVLKPLVHTFALHAQLLFHELLV